MKYTVPCFGLIVANFLWVAIGDGSFNSAVERSFFQAVAILGVALYALSEKSNG